MTDKEYDLSAASLMLGKLIDPREQERIRRERLRSELVEFATTHGVVLKPSDIEFVEDEPKIDSMTVTDWFDHMIGHSP